MDDLSAGLGKLLSDPAALEKIALLASSLTKSEQPPAVSPVDAPQPVPDFLPPPQQVTAPIPTSAPAPDKSQLLYALKPLLSARRQSRVDGLIRALGAAQIIATLKNQKP